MPGTWSHHLENLHSSIILRYLRRLASDTAGHANTTFLMMLYKVQISDPPRNRKGKSTVWNLSKSAWNLCGLREDFAWNLRDIFGLCVNFWSFSTRIRTVFAPPPVSQRLLCNDEIFAPALFFATQTAY